MAFETPDWMKPYVPHLVEIDPKELESIMNSSFKTLNSDRLTAARQISANAQVGLLVALHQKGLLKEPS